jgi:hypothetical protein
MSLSAGKGRTDAPPVSRRLIRRRRVTSHGVDHVVADGGLPVRPTRPRTPGPVGRACRDAHRVVETRWSSVRGSDVSSASESVAAAITGLASADDSDGGVSPTHRGRACSARRSRASRTSGLDQVQRDVLGDRRLERRVATDLSLPGEGSTWSDIERPHRRKLRGSGTTHSRPKGYPYPRP